MSESKTFPLVLGASRWELPELPFGVIKKIQPRLLARNRELVQAHRSGEIAFVLSEAALDDLADLVVLAVRALQPEFDRAALEGLVFPTRDLVGAQVALMQACGLELAAAGEEAPDPKA